MGSQSFWGECVIKFFRKSYQISPFFTYHLTSCFRKFALLKRDDEFQLTLRKTIDIWTEAKAPAVEYIVNGSILTQYGPIDNFSTPGLWLSRNAKPFA